MMKLTAMILLEVNALLSGAPLERPKLLADMDSLLLIPIIRRHTAGLRRKSRCRKLR